jgi:hypothetical protein
MVAHHGARENAASPYMRTDSYGGAAQNAHNTQIACCVAIAHKRAPTVTGP